MRAIVNHRYGGPETLQLQEVEPPDIPEDRVLVRVRASSVNAVDWHLMRGEPYLVRLTDGLRAPKQPRRGVDIAGVIESVGSAVTTLKPGDEVFGGGIGAFGELARAKAANVVAKPTNLTFEEAAAVPVAGLTALQGLRDKGGLTAGQRILVNGAGGGVGTFAVQIAKAFGASVTAVTRTENLELLSSLGADRVIDYSRDDFTRDGSRYDVIFDAGGNRSLGDLARATEPDGVVIVCGAGKGNWVGPFARVAAAMLRSRVRKPRMVGFLASHGQADMVVLKGLLEAGSIRPVIDRTYPLEQTADAVAYMERGHARGKVVITVSAV
jgi:NADPH:quinone reductase-like Zn-dependent oxidoreductase